MKKIIVINAGPRSGWNTDQLIKEAMKGAESTGAEVEYISLYKLEPYRGCMACFGCKREKTYGHCVIRDSLTEVLEKIREADGLIIGSPNYLQNLSSGFRAFYERLVFQSLTYNAEEPNCNHHMIPVLLITTSNVSEELYDRLGYTAMLDNYKQNLSDYVGPTTVFICGNTVQVKDYSQFRWTKFDHEAKQKHHDETFENYLEKAESLGAELFK